MRKKKYHRIITVYYNRKKGYFIESGRIENTTHNDKFYFMINGNLTKDCWELRKDEALTLITCLSAALNNKLFQYLDLSEGGKK